jgi:Skp family chaperone for outer membrane proteins
MAVLGVAILLAALIVVIAFVLGVITPRRRWNGDAELARWVGTRSKDVASDLLSAVELADAPPRPGAPSPALVEALIKSTSDRLGGVEPAALIEVGEVRRARRWALLAMAANLAVVIAAPGLVSAGWRGLLSSPPSPYDGATLSTVPLVGDLEAVLHFPLYSKRAELRLPSSSGDVRGLPGTTVSLHARVLVPASSVEIVIEPGPSSPTAETRTIAAKLDANQVSAELVIDHSAHYRFAVTSPGGGRAIEATPRAIEAEPDQAPVVQLMAPADVLDVANVRRVELAYVIEDDFGLTSAELVWESGKDHGKKPITLDTASGRATGKMVWDIAEVNVPSGGDVRYWLEAKDNDTVSGPNIGRSRELHLKVTSPRERHEETLGRQQELAEKIVKNLGGRLTGPGDDQVAREELSRQLREAIVELGSIVAAYEKDPHASDAMRKALSMMRDRLDRMVTTEQKLIPKGKQPLKGAYAGVDARLVGELEDDTIVLADWLDRERLEGLLDISDEIAAHQKRLSDLLAQYARTKDPRLLDEIEREMRALDKSFAELDHHRRGMPEDVLDQYVNRDAVQPQQGVSCIDEVRKLVHAGQTKEAQQKLEQCQQQHERSAQSLEGSLASLRGDKFSDEQKKLDEVMNELSDVAKDQDDIASEANRIFEAYAEKADELAKDHRREAAKKVGTLVDKLRRRIKDINEAGLTPFAKEEMDIVSRRLDDVEHMVADGDLAEGLGMAHQAKNSLDTIAGELEAALNDDPKSKWAPATEDALDGVSKARPVAKELIDELQSLSPRPDQIMSGDDQRALDRLRRREAMNKDRTKRLSDRTKQLGPELPGDAGSQLGKKLGTAVEQMGSADDRMKAKDPSGTREATRAAADALAKARDRARSAARQAQEGAVGDEPIRIPGADEYKAPERFREELIEAMKKGSKIDGYEDMLKRYQEELTK